MKGDYLSNTITWINKDLISKRLSDHFGAKHFALYGLDLPPITEYLPTELPTIEATDRVIDRLFRLADGSYLLVDFESLYKRKNFIKYLRYISRVLNKFLTENHPVPLRLVVIYTGDVRSAPAVYETNCLTLRVEQAFLSHIDGNQEFHEISAKMKAGTDLNEEEQMQLILLPLTFPGKAQKIQMLDRVVDTVARLPDDGRRSFLLAGLCVANNKFMTDEQTDRIEVMLRMTKVGQKIYNDWRKQTISYGNEQRQDEQNRIARNMLNHGYDEVSVMEMTGLTLTQIDAILGRTQETS